MQMVAARSFVGVDPGVQGAIAVIGADGSLELHSMPVAGREFLVQDIRALFAAIPNPTVTIELASFLPQGTTATGYKQGRGSGLIEGILAGLGIPYQFVRPSAWKAAMGIPKGGGKDAARPVAQQLFPAHAEFLGKRRADYADAALLAEWCRRKNR